ncbi:sensor histidine kinase [Roseateles sp. DB2]|uniref:sensor histidine kinase n=1 Tax=Roseateles sp. DB2 TaxID=3453717 RepID=UPI003EEA44A6
MPESDALLLPRRFWWIYAGLLAGVATFFALAELQHYLRNGRQHPWEPFLWEFSSVLVVALLLPPIFRWHRASLGRGMGVLLGRHALGYAAYTLLHVVGMFGLRFAVYALTPVSYDPGNAWQVLGYEAAKDLVFYVSNVLLCHALWVHLRGQRTALEMARMRTELAQAQLARLAEQLQPHFLFNSLNLIASVMHEDVNRADRLLCQLSDLLRASLSAQQRGWQTLAEEMALVQPYLALMQARFGERLQVHIELEPGAEAWELPALLLLNPVENAVKHDVALSRGAVEVSLHAQLRQDGLQVQIRNSGVSAEQVARAGGLGLSNLRERLRMAYGEAAQLWIGPDQGGTLLRLQLPRREGQA